MTVSNMMLVREFCNGLAPSEVDKKLGCEKGRTRRAIVRWWAEDKEFHNGGIETVLGDDWDRTVRKSIAWRKLG